MSHLGRLAASLALLAGAAITAITAISAPTAAAAPAAAASAPATTGAAAPRLDHVFLIMEENNGFADVIGNKAAPNLNYLARTFGVATDYYGLSTDSSETNYVGLLGGSTYNVTSDDAYWKNTVNAPSVISQLDQAGVGWKAYLQGLPYVGYQGICYPAKCNGAPDSDPLYVSKHDTIQNFTTSWNAADWSRQVPIGQLTDDLNSGDIPRFGYIVPDECHDMHGDPPYCLDSGSLGDPQQQHLDSVGDAYLGQLVAEITHASFWANGNNAIIVTYDNGDDSKGCCDANPGGGQVATVVVTSHGPRGITDSQPANHYSTLSSIQQAFGLGCLKNTCDTKNVTPISELLAASGSTAIATKVQPELSWPTPTLSQPAEPVSVTKPVTGLKAGWQVLQTQLLGTSDNSLGAIAGSSSSDIWAAGNYLPDQTDANQDATLTFAEHWNGTSWQVVRTPNTGSNFNSFYGLAASHGNAWAVGEYLNSAYRDRLLVEVWNGSSWSIADTPQPGAVRDMGFGAAALSPDDVWVVGDQEGRDNVFETLAEHWNGRSWSVVPTPNPGPTGNHLYAVDAVSPDDVWAVGQQVCARVPDRGLVEHWDGRRWSVVPLSASDSGNVLLDAVKVTDGQVWVAGESDSPADGGRPLVERYADGHWYTEQLPPVPDHANWANLYGIAVADGGVWVTGTYVDPATDNNNAFVLRDEGGSWTVDDGPDPGSGSNIPGGITAVNGELWLAGTYEDGGSREPLVARR